MALKILSFFLLVAIVLPAAPAAGAQPSKVRISYSSRSHSITPFVLAAHKGFFAEEGVEVELIQVIQGLAPQRS